MIGKTLGNLRIVSVIGEGGMGVVYLAEHVGLPKRFAVKSLSRALSGDPDFRRRFAEEAKKQALLDDPNIVQVTDFIEASGEFFLVMEYVDGQDLSHLIKSKGRLPEPEALTIVRDILKGLAFAHAEGLVHRDMKPSNVLVDRSGRARIMDFGIAIMAGGVEKSLTAAGATIGSPWYMSPEQIVRPHQVDQRTDIYALGIVLYEMLTGGLPFDAETDFEVKDQQIRAPARDPRETNPDISPGLAQIVLKAMAKDPGERFQSCHELLEAIDALQKRDVRRRPWALVAALVATLVVSGGIIGYQHLTPAQRPGTPGDQRGDRSPSSASDLARERAELARQSALEKAELARQSALAKAEVERQSTLAKTELARQSALAKTELARQSAYNVIQSGAEKASLTCTEFERLTRKEGAGLQAARETKDTNIEEQLWNQIRQHRMNIESALGTYAGFLQQLAAVDPAVVGEEFDRYMKDLQTRQSFQQIQIARVMKRHYERQRGGNGKVDAGAMGADCGAALGKGA